MSRNVLILSGAVCWTVAAVVAALHAASGDMLVPAGMAAVLAVWVGLRRHQLRLLRTTA
jgi:hypothetical protein